MKVPHNVVRNPKAEWLVEKKCSKCGVVKSSGEFSSYRYTTAQGKESRRLASHCKACIYLERRTEHYHMRVNAAARKRNPESKERWLAARRASVKEIVDTKHCHKCGETKAAVDFHKNRLTRDGLDKKCKKCSNEQARDYLRRNPAKHKVWVRKSSLKKNFGITLEDFNRMFDEQGGACLICKKLGMTLGVDHCHKTRRIRGLLCNHCNLALGGVNEDLSIVDGLAAYIRNYCGV